MKPRQLGGARYLGLEGRDSPRGKVVSVHVNNFVDHAHALLSKRDNMVDNMAILPKTSWWQGFSCDPGTVSSLQH